VAADGLPRQGYPSTRACFVSHDRPGEGVTGPSGHRWPSCAAGAVRTSCSWAISKVMHVSINAGGDACIGRRASYALWRGQACLAKVGAVIGTSWLMSSARSGCGIS
jgi:hypothetical protein